MPQFVSKIAHVYADRSFAPGDLVDIDERHVPLLKALGRIDDIDTTQRAGEEEKQLAAGTAATYETRHLQAGKRRTSTLIREG